MKSTLTIIAISLLLFACGGEQASENLVDENSELKKELAELTAMNNEYEEGIGLFENDIESYRTALAEIEENIAAVDTKHQMVIDLKGNVEGDKSVEADILAHIDHIHAIMLNSKHKINHLNKSLDEAVKSGKISEDSIQVLDQTFYDLATAVYVQDKVIKGMHTMIVDDAAKIKELDKKYESQKMESEVLHLIINTKFYVVGTKDELLEKGIISEEGGLLGLNRVHKLSADANATLFTTIDAVSEYIINFEAKEAKALTLHSEENYLFLGEQDNAITGIEINDYKAFWDKSDFLVIEIK